jgi:putative sterol carrier protein
MTVPTFGRIISGEVAAPRAFLEGRIEISGDYQVAARMSEWFGQGPAS